MKNCALLLLCCALYPAGTAFASPEGRRQTASSYISAGLEKAKAGNYAGAVKDFDRVLKIDPANNLACFNRGVALLKLKKPYDAEKDFQKACSLGNKEGCKVAQQLARKEESKAEIVKGLLADAEAMFTTGRIEDALSKLRIAEDKMPDYAPIFYARARIYFREQRQKEALTNLNQAIELNSSYADAHFMRGLLYRDRKDPSNAMKDFDRDIALDGTNPRSYREKADLLLEDREYEDAARNYAAALDKGAADVAVYFGLGAAQENILKLDASAASFDKACSLGNDKACGRAKDVRKKLEKLQGKVDELIFEGIKAYKSGDNKKALKSYTKALDIYPYSFQARLARGNLYLESLHNDAAAIKDLDAAIEVSSVSAVAYRQRAAAYKNTENIQAAILDINRSLELDGSSFEALTIKASLHALNREYKEAVRQYESLIRMRPERPELHFALANTFKNAGNMDKALAQFGEACKLGMDTACSWKKSLEKPKPQPQPAL